MNCDSWNINLALSKTLLQYRSISHALTNKTPAELFIGRKLWTRLDLIRPTKEESIVNQNETKKFFEYKKKVACRNYTAEGKWKLGQIIQRLGKLHYRIRLDDGRSWTRHVNQMRPIGENTPIVENSQNDNFY